MRCYVGTEYGGYTTQCYSNEVCSKDSFLGRQPDFSCSTLSDLDYVGFTAYIGYELNCQNVPRYGEICACNSDNCNDPRKPE